ncbi:hypothetical protein PXW86_27690, partial [Klebsiella pneumoniae]|nr:hypothetical protein [Klebsiella pneumoniae]
SRTGHVVQLECQAMSLRVTTADYARAVRAWELTGERRGEISVLPGEDYAQKALARLTVQYLSTGGNK